MVLRSGRKLSPLARQGISGMVLIYPPWMTHVLFLVLRKSSQAVVVPEAGDAKKDQRAGSLTALVFWSTGLCWQSMNQAAQRWGIGAGD